MKLFGCDFSSPRVDQRSLNDCRNRGTSGVSELSQRIELTPRHKGHHPLRPHLVSRLRRSSQPGSKRFGPPALHNVPLQSPKSNYSDLHCRNNERSFKRSTSRIRTEVFLSSATPHPETPIQVVQHTFSSVDQLAEETAGWDLDWRQLDRGPLDAPYVLIMSPDAFFTGFSFNRRFLQRGHSPPGRLTFGLLGESVGEIEWCRASADNRHLLIFNSGGDYESVSQPGFHGNTMSYSVDHLEGIACDLELDVDFGRFRNVETVLEIDPTGASDLRHHLLRIHRTTSAETSAIGPEWIRNELEYEIPARLLRLFTTNSRQVTTLIDGFKDARRKGRATIWKLTPRNLRQSSR